MRISSIGGALGLVSAATAIVYSQCPHLRILAKISAISAKCMVALGAITLIASYGISQQLRTRKLSVEKQEKLLRQHANLRHTGLGITAVSWLLMAIYKIRGTLLPR